jgi:hypothetical protein
VVKVQQVARIGIAGKVKARGGGDAVSSSRSGNEADAGPPPCPCGLRPGGLQQNVTFIHYQALTSALAQLLRSMGWKAEYILVDRSYGQSKHCALLVWVDGTPHLLDPGFLIVNPIHLKNEGEQEIRTSFNRLVLAPGESQNRVSLFAVRKGAKICRLTYKTSPVNTWTPTI